MPTKPMQCWREKIDVLRALLHSFDYGDYPDRWPQAAGRCRQPCVGAGGTAKKRFADNALAMSKAFSLCCTLDEARAVRDEVAFLQAVRCSSPEGAHGEEEDRRGAGAGHPPDHQQRRGVPARWWMCLRRWGSTSPTSDCSMTTSSPRCATCPNETWQWVAGAAVGGEIKAKFASNLAQEKKFSELLTKVISVIRTAPSRLLRSSRS